MTNVPIISVTGTKGKTTTVAIIDDVLRYLGKNTVKVDTTGHFVNGERKSTLQDSQDTWGIVPSKAPGRYLWEFHANPDLAQNAAAVLECSLGCSLLPGLGYKFHDVGVFLNVFEDHLGTSDRLKTKEDIAKAKSFIFSRVKYDGGYAVFNADDELVVRSLDAVYELAEDTHYVAMGLTFDHIDEAKRITGHQDFPMITLEGTDIVLKRDSETIVSIDLKAIPWTFAGAYGPSVWNIMAALGAVYGYYDGNLPDGIKQAFESVRLDPYGGRLTVLRADNGATIIADYAHEKVSLKTIGELARSTVKDGGKTIGVVRLAYDRTDETLRETGAIIGSSFDQVIVYDKIDGHFRMPEQKSKRFPQAVGRISEIVLSGVKETNDNAVQIIREDEAIVHAASIAGPNDIVIVIVNDDIHRSMDFIQQSFKADFV